MEFTVKTDEEALIVFAYKVFNLHVKPRLIHDDNRVWIKSEYTLHKNTYVFDPNGKLMYAHCPNGC